MKKQEKVAFNQKKTKQTLSIADPQMNQMLELQDRDIYNLLKNLEENMDKNG